MDNDKTAKNNIDIDLNNINLIIRSKQGILFKDTVKALTSYNEKGVFDILPEHANFISIIKEKIIIHKNLNQNQEMKIENGVLRVYKNKVNIYVGV